MNRSWKLSLPWQRSLRTRLTLLFALLGLLPALVVGYSVLRNQTRSMDVWENPGVTRTMESVRVVARTSVTKLVQNLAVHARILLEDGVITGALDAGDDPSIADGLEQFRHDTEIDLAALYRRADGAWTSVALACADPVELTPAELDLAIQLTSLQTDDHGYLVSAFPFDADGAEHALVVGYKLGPEYLPSLESIASGLTYYGQLRLARQVSRQTAFVTAGATTLVILGLALILGRKVARGVSRPVEELVDGMERVGRGELVRVRPRGTDELRYLTTSFNRMSSELAETRAELARAERLAAWQEMARRIAHEIRNPLTPIQFALHRLQKRAVRGESPEPQVIDDAVNAILEELDGLKTLAGTFSEFAKLPDPEPVEFPLEELVTSVAELADDDQGRVRLDLDPALPPIRGDRKGLRRILTNLVKNAQETGATTVTLRTRLDPGEDPELDPDRMRLGPGGHRPLLAERHAVVTVADDGPGVAADALDQIFMPDYSTKPTGTGLGLAIVCRIVAQHGGALVVERGDERGVHMHVHLPLNPEDDTP